MDFSVFLPPQADAAARCRCSTGSPGSPAPRPTSPRRPAPSATPPSHGLMIVAPDTSPRGTEPPGRARRLRLRLGRRLLRRRDARRPGRATTACTATSPPSCRSWSPPTSRPTRPPGHLRPLDGRPRRADLRAAAARTASARVSAFAPIVVPDALPLGREGVHRLSGRGPRPPGGRYDATARWPAGSAGAGDPRRPGHWRRFPGTAAAARSCSRPPAPPPASR